MALPPETFDELFNDFAHDVMRDFARAIVGAVLWRLLAPSVMLADAVPDDTQ